MKWMPPSICLQMSVSYSLATLLLFLGELCHCNLPTERWIRRRLCPPGLAADVAAGLAPVHGSPTGQLWTLLAVGSSSWSKGHVKHPLTVYLAREAHLKWHQFTPSTELRTGTWHLVLLNSDLSYSPQNGSSFFISQRFCLWNSYSRLNIFHTIYDSWFIERQ